MRIRHPAAAAALALGAAAAAGPWTPGPAFAFEETASIQGVVVAEDGGAPLPAALVVLDGAATSATTGADGRFTIAGVPAGTYRLTVTREAFAALTAPVTVVAGQPVLLDLRLPALQFEERVVVTATRTERAVTDVAASVTILDAETIEASAARNLQDLLRRTPALDLAETSGMAARANSSLVMRGVPGTKRALLLVDGLPANDLGLGTLAALSLVPLESVERAEVVRGPFSSLYGANAFAGAVNVITRPGEGPPDAGFFASGGSAGYYQLGASARGESGPVAYAFTADRRRMDNVYNRDTRTIPSVADDGSLQPRTVPLRNVGYEDARMTGRLDLAVSDAWDLTLLPRISRYETGLDVSSRLPVTAEEHKRDTAVNLGGILRHDGAGPLSARIRTSYRYSNQSLFQENFTLAPTRQTVVVDPPGPAVRESVTRGVFPFAALTGQDTGFHGVLVEPQLAWAPNLAHTVVFGASYAGERGAFGDSAIADRSNLLGSDEALARVAAGIQAGMAAGGAPNPTVTLVRDPAIGAVFPLSQGRRERFDVLSAYVQDEWLPADRLRLVPGLRYDRHSEFGSVASPKVALLYALTPATRVRTSAGRAFRAPSLFELFGNVVFHGPIPGLPNPELKPEHISSFDGGIQHEAGRALRTEVNVFHNDMTDLIQLVIAPRRDHFDWVNVAEARSTGLELVANGQAASWLGYYANYAYTDSEDRATGAPLALVPRHKVNAGIQWNAALGSWRLSGSVDQRWVGERTQSSQGVPVLLDEYARTDLAFHLHPNEDLRVGFHVLNVLDADYQETAASPTLGRFVSMSLTVTPFR